MRPKTLALLIVVGLFAVPAAAQADSPEPPPAT
jgi:hypothetical protein